MLVFRNPTVLSLIKNPSQLESFDEIINHFIHSAIKNKMGLAEPFPVPSISLKPLNYYPLRHVIRRFVNRIGSYSKGENGIKGTCFKYQFTDEFFLCDFDFKDTKSKKNSIDYDYNEQAVLIAENALKAITLKYDRTVIKTAKQASKYIRRVITANVTKSYVANRISLNEKDKTYQKKGKILNIETPMKDFIELKVRASQTSLAFLLNEIRQKQFFISNSETNGRTNNSFTSLSDIVIDLIRIDDEKIQGKDVKNCQFVLLAHLIENCIKGSEKTLFNFIYNNSYDRETLGKGYKVDTLGSKLELLNKVAQSVKIGADFDLFFEHAANGVLYDKFSKSLGISRTQAKNTFFLIFFGNSPKAAAALDFKSQYPTVFEICRKFKKQSDYTSLSIMLQRVESLIFVNHLSPIIYNTGIKVLTKHDSIYSKVSDFCKMDKIVSSELNHILNSKYKAV